MNAAFRTAIEFNDTGINWLASQGINLNQTFRYPHTRIADASVSARYILSASVTACITL